MSLTNYDGLKSSIASWLNRTDLVDQIPLFIELAENRISRDVRVPVIEKTVLLSLDSQGYADLPADFLEAKDVFYEYNPLDKVSLAQIHRFESLLGAPTCFARETYRLKVFPTPQDGATDELRMIYYYDLGRLSDNQQTHALLQIAPELYLYGALSEAADFLGADVTQKESWEYKFQTAVAALIRLAANAEFAGSTPIIASGY